MGVDSIVNLITSVGFPIVACWYLATTLNKSMQDMTKSNQDLTNAIIGMQHSDTALKETIERSYKNGE